MRYRKLLAWALSLSIAAGLFAGIPLCTAAAATSSESIEILLPDAYDSIYQFMYEYPDILWVENEGKIGLYFADEKKSVGGTWDSLWNFSGGYAVFTENGLYGVVSSDARVVVPAEWDEIIINSGNITVRKNGLMGLVSSEDGSVLFDPQAEEIESFENGYAAAVKGGKYGIISSSGELAAGFIYEDARPFSEGLAPVKNSSGKWGYINLSGDTVIDFVYDAATCFSDGSAYVVQNGRMFAINKSGAKYAGRNDLIPEYDASGRLAAPDFGGFGAACVRFYGENNYRYIDSEGNALTDALFMKNTPLSENGTAVQRTGSGYALLKAQKSGASVQVKTLLESDDFIFENSYSGFELYQSGMRVYNDQGDDIFGCDVFDVINDSYDSGIVTGIKSDGYISAKTDGTKLYEDKYDRAVDAFGDNLLIASEGMTVPYILSSGGSKTYLGSSSATAYGMDDWIMIVDGDGKYGAYRTDGTCICPAEYDMLVDLGEGKLGFSKNQTEGFIDKADGTVTDGFRNVYGFDDGMAWVNYGNRAGTVDENGDTVIEPLYWPYDTGGSFTVFQLTGGVTAVRTGKDSLYCFIDKNGNRLTNPEFASFSFISQDLMAFSRGTGKYGLLTVSKSTLSGEPEYIEAKSSLEVIYVGSSAVIDASVMPDSAADKNVVFASETPEIASVDAAGRVTGKAPGAARIKVSSAADSSVFAYVDITVVGRTIHQPDEAVPLSAWDGQFWLAEAAINQLSQSAPDSAPLDVSGLTYGDLAEITEITIPYIPDNGDGTVYHIPSIIGDFLSLTYLRIGYENMNGTYYSTTNVFSPVTGTLPPEAEYLSDLTVDINCCYSSGYDENMIRVCDGGIPDGRFYAALRDNMAYDLPDPSSGLLKGMAVYYLNAQNYSIQSIEGISLLDLSETYELDLSCNAISDISELARTDISNATVDLRCNSLNLEDPKTITAIYQLEQKGCTVLTADQESVFVSFDNTALNPGLSQNVGYITYADESVDIGSLTVRTENPNICTATINGRYILAHGLTAGQTVLYLCLGDKVLCTQPVTVPDISYVTTPTVTYNVWEYDPTSAEIQYDMDYNDTLYYRKQGSSYWTPADYSLKIYSNGIYEFCAENIYGYRSEIVTVEITEIKRALTADDFADNALYTILKNNYYPLYEDMVIGYLNAAACGITDLGGIELLDFSDASSIDLAYNRISDLTPLVESGIRNCYIDLTGNCLDESDPKTAADIEKLMADNCDVYTDEQFYNEQKVWLSNSFLKFHSDEVNYIYNITLYVFPEEIRDQINVSVDNSGIVDYKVRINEIQIEPLGVTGKTYLRVYLGDEEVAALEIISDDKTNPFAPEVEYQVSEYDQTFATLDYSLNYNETMYYRTQGDSEWIPVKYDTYIEYNGVYEFSYVNEYGYRSRITTLEITGIKEPLTLEDIGDEGLYNALVERYGTDGKIYDNVHLYTLNLDFSDIHSIDALRLFDLSDFSGTVSLRYNYITDISVLKELNLKNCDVYLEGNRLNLNDPDTLAVIRQLEENGCYVNTDNQNFEGTYFEFDNRFLIMDINNLWTDEITYNVYPSGDRDKVSFSLEKGGLFTLSYGDGKITISFTGNLGQDTILAYVGGKLVGSTEVTVYDENILPDPIADVDLDSYENIIVTPNTDYYPSYNSFMLRNIKDNDWQTAGFRGFTLAADIGSEETYEIKYSSFSGAESNVTRFTICNDGKYIYMTCNGETKLLKYIGDVSSLVLPSEIGGYPLTAVGDYAFTYTNLTEIIIPETVVSLGSCLFPYSSNVISLPDSLAEIDEYAFVNVWEKCVVYCTRDCAVYDYIPQITENNCIIWTVGETGDINGDGEVDIRDLIRLKKQAAGTDTGTAGDIDSDGYTDAYDLALLRKYFLGNVYNMKKA